jgi:hypothetical protein
MCTGRDLVARVARARLPYAENLVSGTGLAYMRAPIQHKHKHMRRCAFLGRACTRGAIMRRASTAGAGATTWVRGVGAWRRGWAASVGGVLLAAGRACGNGVRVGMSGAGRRGAFRLCGVEYAWTLGLVRSQVALSGLLLWPQYRALDFHCVGRGWVPKMFLTIRTLRMARS